MKLFVTIYNDARLLAHFLRHYRARGVTAFYIAVVAELRSEIERAARGHPVTLVHGLNVADSVAGTAAVSEMRAAHQQPAEWVVIVDLDEFVECPSLPDIAERAERAGANLVRGIMHDRFAVDGMPHDFGPYDDLSDLYPVKSRFIRDVMKGTDHKGLLVKGLLRPAPRAGHHWFEEERAFGEQLEIAHYKWTGGSIERLRHSLAAVKVAGIGWACEYERILTHFEANGRFAWEAFGGKLREAFVPEPPAAQCTACGGAISEAEHAYSVGAHGRPLCRTHQKNS